MISFDCSSARRSSHEGGCAKHNLEKSDKILSIAPWIFAGNTGCRYFRLCDPGFRESGAVAFVEMFRERPRMSWQKARFRRVSLEVRNEKGCDVVHRLPRFAFLERMVSLHELPC
jgi:hypothetical protein